MVLLLLKKMKKRFAHDFRGQSLPAGILAQKDGKFNLPVVDVCCLSNV